MRLNIFLSKYGKGGRGQVKPLTGSFVTHFPAINRVKLHEILWRLGFWPSSCLWLSWKHGHVTYPEPWANHPRTALISNDWREKTHLNNSCAGMLLHSLGKRKTGIEKKYYIQVVYFWMWAQIVGKYCMKRKEKITKIKIFSLLYHQETLGIVS